MRRMKHSYHRFNDLIIDNVLGLKKWWLIKDHRSYLNAEFNLKKFSLWNYTIINRYCNCTIYRYMLNEMIKYAILVSIQLFHCLLPLKFYSTLNLEICNNSGERIIYKGAVLFHPRSAILTLLLYTAHPKVMAYVMQGGLQSLQEAVHYSVPVVAIPFFGDQLFNARKILDAGIGLTLDIDTITEESIVQTLTNVIENKTWV